MQVYCNILNCIIMETKVEVCMDRWVVIGVEPHILWPEAEITVSYNNRDIIMRPGNQDRYPDVSILSQPKEDYYQPATLLQRFLSVLSWWNGGAIITIGHIGGSHRCRVGGRKMSAKLFEETSPFIQKQKFTVEPWPVLLTDSQRLAVAVYREALGLNHDTYKFLGFFKILNIRLNGPGQIAWINQNVVNLDHIAAERIQAIRKLNKDIGNYLYVQGRCAVAHANSLPTVDPDELEATHRINLDLSIIKQLAELFIKVELGLPRPQ